MQLSRNEISRNYFETLKLASNLINKSRSEKGYMKDLSSALISELAQSAAGSEPIVKLIQTEHFNADTYGCALLIAIDECKRELFPDVKKRRFISISQTGLELSSEETAAEPTHFHLENSISIVWHKLKLFLNDADFKYLNELLNTKSLNPDLLFRVFNLHYLSGNEPDFSHIGNKISLFRKMYPQGLIPETANPDIQPGLSETDIISCYKNVYLGIERSFPLQFLNHNAQYKSAVLTRYLIEEILETSPQKILENEDETFFIRHKLQNVYRLFNYSANRALANAYPEIIHPWLSSRTPENYWQDQSNRIMAINWLVEEKLQIKPKDIYKHAISRKDFAKNGLSFMFNHYFNSVGKALREAYPDLNPWETGPVPNQFWNDENSANAIHWMVRKNNWKPEDLPRLVSLKKFNRKTFSRFGLATLLEKKFNKNLYQAINLAYPGKFGPWEFGKVPKAYWSDHKNLQRAAYWMAEKEGIENHEIPEAVRRRRLTNHSLKKYSFGAALKRKSGGRIENLFAHCFWKEHNRYLEDYRIMNKLEKMIRKEKQRRHFGFYLLYGFFIPNMQTVSDAYVDQYERILKRRKRYMDIV
jgi:hypothetical protein